MGKIIKYIWYVLFVIIVAVGSFFIFKEEELGGYIPQSEDKILEEFNLTSIELIDKPKVTYSKHYTKEVTTEDFDFYYGTGVGGGFKLIGLHKHYSENQKTYFIIENRDKEVIKEDESEGLNRGLNMINEEFAPMYLDSYNITFYDGGNLVLDQELVNYYENALITQNAEEQGLSENDTRQGKFHSIQGFDFNFDIEDYEKFELFLKAI